MLKHQLRFSFLLLLSAGIAYVVHTFVYSQISSQDATGLINFTYQFNVGITFLFGNTMIIASEKIKDQLGFIFLVSIAVKLGIFGFLTKTSEFEIGKSNFLHFFIPYVVCVVIEIVYVIKILNGDNFNVDS
ncbi:MAG: DUF6168 family protein [Salinimicrobium sp.]